LKVVVSETSPLRALGHLGRLDLLTILFGEVTVPPAVAAELLRPRGPFPPLDVSGIVGVRIVAPADPQA